MKKDMITIAGAFGQLSGLSFLKSNLSTPFLFLLLVAESLKHAGHAMVPVKIAYYIYLSAQRITFVSQHQFSTSVSMKDNIVTSSHDYMCGRSLGQMFLVRIGFQPYLTSLAFRSASAVDSLRMEMLRHQRFAIQLTFVSEGG
jgi:hypothetical protein